MKEKIKRMDEREDAMLKRKTTIAQKGWDCQALAVHSVTHAHCNTRPGGQQYNSPIEPKATVSGGPRWWRQAMGLRSFGPAEAILPTARISVAVDWTDR